MYNVYMSNFIKATLINEEEKKSRPMNPWLAAELDRVYNGVVDGTIKTYTWAQVSKRLLKIINA